MSNKKAEDETMDAGKVYTMFEELNDKMERVEKKLERPPTPAPAPVAAHSVTAALAPEDRAAIRTLSAKIDRHGETMEASGEKMETLAPKLDEVGEKVSRPLIMRHAVDFMSNRALIAFAGVAVLLACSLYVNHRQGDTIALLRDNDLKYRHIQMQGEAAPADIERLRDLFDWNRNADSIRTIRRRVAEYERLVRQGAEKSERARLNTAEAQRLNNAAETVKSGGAKDRK